MKWCDNETTTTNIKKTVCRTQQQQQKNEAKKRSKQGAFIEITNFVDTGVFLIGHSQQQQAANIVVFVKLCVWWYIFGPYLKVLHEWNASPFLLPPTNPTVIPTFDWIFVWRMLFVLLSKYMRSVVKQMTAIGISGNFYIFDARRFFSSSTNLNHLNWMMFV